MIFFAYFLIQILLASFTTHTHFIHEYQSTFLDHIMIEPPMDAHISFWLMITIMEFQLNHILRSEFIINSEELKKKQSYLYLRIISYTYLPILLIKKLFSLNSIDIKISYLRMIHLIRQMNVPRI